MKAKKIVLVDYTKDSLESNVIDKLKTMSHSLVFANSSEEQSFLLGKPKNKVN